MNKVIENEFNRIDPILKDIWDIVYSKIDWHYDLGMRQLIMDKRMRETKFELQEVIENALDGIDDEILDWELEHEQQWFNEGIKAIKADLAYQDKKEQSLWRQ